MKCYRPTFISCLLALCLGCSEDDSRNLPSEPIVTPDPASVTCEHGTVRCDKHADGSQYIMTCRNGEWHETASCTGDKPVCDKELLRCVADPLAQGNCDISQCSAPEHGIAKCTSNGCDFDCENHYQKDGQQCTLKSTDSPICGDGKCSHGETCSSCKEDCGPCASLPICGDGQCKDGETCSSCEQDCGKCEDPKPVCGDGICNGYEDCSNCETDCNACPNEPKCGDGECNGEETCLTCEADCKVCPPCGNGTCDADENYASCKTDCADKHPCANGCPNKMIFLYVGDFYNTDNGKTGTYEKYTAEDIDNFGVTHFVLSPTGGFPAYGLGNEENLYPKLIQTMRETIMTIIHSTNGKNKRVWIGTPPIRPCTDIKEKDLDDAEFFTKHTEVINQYIDDLRFMLGAEIWNNYVEGIYMNSEAVYISNCYKAVDVSNLNGHLHVKMFKDISNNVHRTVKSDEFTWNAKLFLWAPYYPDSHNKYFSKEYIQEHILTMGSVINKAAIFDEVLMQPSHYFTEQEQPENLDAIKQSTYKQAATWLRDGDNECKIVGEKKNSATKIGVQMEIDWEYTSSEVKKKRYQDYVSYFNNETDKIDGYDKNKYRFSYYLGSKDTSLAELQEVIREFYGVEPF